VVVVVAEVEGNFLSRNLVAMLALAHFLGEGVHFPGGAVYDEADHLHPSLRNIHEDLSCIEEGKEKLGCKQSTLAHPRTQEVVQHVEYVRKLAEGLGVVLEVELVLKSGE
jgi:hypothetical protein